MVFGGTIAPQHAASEMLFLRIRRGTIAPFSIPIGYLLFEIDKN
jgi:hypothetical protein